MLEIFIPTGTKKYKLEINKISDHFLDVLEKMKIEDNIVIEKFDSNFFEGIKIFSKKINNNLLILCNGEFGNNYFLDYDIIENKNIISFGNSIGKIKNLEQDLGKIQINIKKIINFLNSKKLLTNSKKSEILIKIKNSFFALSGVIFLLYSLKSKADENLSDLENYSGKIEYEAQAMLLKETSLTKSIELKANIDKLEGKIEMFIDVISKFIK